MEAEAIVSSPQILTKVCSKCPERGEQPLSAFAKNGARGRGYRRSICKECSNKYFRECKVNPPPKRKRLTADELLFNMRKAAVKSKRKRLYGLTDEQYQSMFEAQNGVCAICGRPETRKNQYGVCSLAVDHDHSTGRVRALLCQQCNWYVGIIENPPPDTSTILAYLKKYSVMQSS